MYRVLHTNVWKYVLGMNYLFIIALLVLPIMLSKGINCMWLVNNWTALVCEYRTC